VTVALQRTSPRLQWGRRVSVQIGKNDPTGKTTQPYLRVTDLHVSFEVLKTSDRTPNTATIRIFNLSPENDAKIRGEYDDAQLLAGYGVADQELFRGNIHHAYRYKDGADWITELSCGDGDKDYQQTVIAQTLAAGHVSMDWVKVIGDAFAKNGGTKLGTILLKGSPRTRGRTFVGNASKLLNEIAALSDAHWSIQDGLLHIIGVDTTLPWEAVRLASDTGLLGAPEVTDKGIAFKCLLNPALKIYGKVWLDNNNLRLKSDREHVTAKGKVKGKLARLDPDGVYKVFKLNFKGDTRGTDWVTEGQCIGLDEKIPRTTQPVMTASSDMVDVPDGAL
jgi:hypothetical protein